MEGATNISYIQSYIAVSVGYLMNAIRQHTKVGDPPHNKPKCRDAEMLFIFIIRLINTHVDASYSYYSPTPRTVTAVFYGSPRQIV